MAKEYMARPVLNEKRGIFFKVVFKLAGKVNMRLAKVAPMREFRRFKHDI